MYSLEFVNAAGYRLDGRLCNETRNITVSHGEYATSDGSASIKQGLTHIIVLVKGPSDSTYVKQANQTNFASVLINCDINISNNLSTDIRRGTKLDIITAEISLLIKKVFKSIIIVPLSKRSQITFSVEILDCDGCLKSTIINCCTLALIDAGVAVKSLVFSSSVCYLDKIVLADPTQLETNYSTAELTIATESITNNPIYIDLASKVSEEGFKKVGY